MEEDQDFGKVFYNWKKIMEKGKTVLTVGVFDLLHRGHVLLLKHAKEQGDRLIVAVQDSEYIHKYKPNASIANSTEDRLLIVGSIKYVDDVVVYQDVDTIVQQVDFDVFARGGDQNHSGFQKASKWCEEHGKSVVILPRTEGVSSSEVRAFIRDSK